MVFQVEEIVIDYSACNSDALLTTDPNKPMDDTNYMSSEKFYYYFKDSTADGGDPQWRRYTTNVTYKNGIAQTVTDSKFPTKMAQICQLQFQIPNDIGPPVLLYYRLTNFYQNHRRYVKSFDPDQLLGKNVTSSTIQNGGCDPLQLDSSGKPYYPCGLIANSMFNDTIWSPKGISSSENYTMVNTGIAWDSDKKLYGPSGYHPSDVAVPLNWHDRWGDEGYTDTNPPPNLGTYEEFQVWMRTAGLPAFSKLARRNDTDVMRKGRYQIDIVSSMCSYPANLL